MARRPARVVIPGNADALIALAQKVYAKSQSDPDSPLKALDMAMLNSQAQAAQDQNERAKQLARDAELATSARDNALGETRASPDTVLFLLTQARDLLLAMNKDDPRRLGDYGFDVVESNPKPEPPPAP